MKSICCLLLFLLGISSLLAEPTEGRSWTSTAQTTISGRALSLVGNQVVLETEDGRKLTVPLSKLVAADQAYLKKHFAGKLATPPNLESPAGLPFEQGSVHGPIDAGNGSTYFLYLPTTLKADYQAPLFFWTGSGRSNPNTLKPFIEVSELTGMILAASVQSSNNNKGPTSNVGHSGQCLEHISQTLPVEPDRIIFSGQSGGGATAFQNADNFNCSGVFPYVAYMPGASKPKNGKYVYAAGGAWDFNRYLSAYAAASYGKDGTHRLYPGGHKTDRDEVPTEGVCWLYTRELYGSKVKREEETAQFEYRFLTYLREQLVSEKPHLAFYWCDHLLNQCEIRGPFQTILEELSTELAPANQRYLDGRKALDEFSIDHFAKYGENGGSQYGHTTSAIESAAEKLAAEYAGVIDIEETARELSKKTVPKK